MYKLRRVLKVQCFSLWYHTSTPLSSGPKISLAEHTLSNIIFFSLYPTISIFTLSMMAGSCDGISVRVSRSYTDSRVFSWTILIIFQVSPQKASLISSSRLAKRPLSFPSRYLRIYNRARYSMETKLVGTEGSNVVSGLGFKVGSLRFFLLEFRVPWYYPWMYVCL